MPIGCAKCLKGVAASIIFLDVFSTIIFALLLDGFTKSVDYPAPVFTNNTLAENCEVDLYSFILFLQAHNIVFGLGFCVFFLGAFTALIGNYSEIGTYTRLNFVIGFYGIIPLFLILVPIFYNQDEYIVNCGCTIIGILIIYRIIVWVCMVLQNSPKDAFVDGNDGDGARKGEKAGGVNDKKAAVAV